jgi:3-oxoacyl-[acyl-carrier protein] reductase
MNDQKELSGLAAIVTGSAHNIGRAIAISLAEAGAAVVVTALQSAAAANKVMEDIQANGGRAMTALADLTQPQAVRDLVEKAMKEFGRLDIVVNNAAIRHESDLDTMTYEDFRAVTSVILDGAFLLTQTAKPHLVQSNCGSIINIGGATAHFGAPKRSALLAAKNGLVGLTKAFAHDFAPFGVTVNCVVPGMMTTVRGRSATAPLHDPDKVAPIGRRGRPSDIAAMTRFLTGPGARFVTGQTLHVNGGSYMP